jgi:glycosyltransferase involved in cell wall biosynthesis
MHAFSGSIIENGREGKLISFEPMEDTENFPLVSCLMVSRGKLFPARFAIACFQSQTYGNRELVIVIDDPACELVSHVASLNDPRIRLVEAPVAAQTLGALRNVSVAEARGEYVCQWDDDDLYAPERIQTQLAALRSAQVAACVLRRWMLWWRATERLAISGARSWEGSILALRQAMLPYPGLRRGEDSEMLAAMMQRERILCLEAPHLYLYTHHGNNTFSEQHFSGIYGFSRQRWVKDAYWKRLADLSRIFPVREYLHALSPVNHDTELTPPPAFPLVSIIVRSTGRPELRLALESLAAQDYPALEVIVVDATGGAHPPLPDIAWRPGHGVRLLTGNRRLLRPHAANAGLDAIEGEWFGFLDDDDSFDADHVSVLMKAAVSTDRLVVYGMSRLVDGGGETRSMAGLPFNQSNMFYGPILCFPTALIRRRVRDLGCRFDERFEICEDRDFFWQIAEHSDFEHVRHVSFNYAIELGTSGTAHGNNRDVVRSAWFDQLLRHKWLGVGGYHSARALAACRKAVAFHIRGNVVEAREIFYSVLREYADDSNALNGLGYIALMTGALDDAEKMLRRAIEVNPAASESRFHLATVLARIGATSGARQQAWLATADPALRDVALQLLSRLGGPPPQAERQSPSREIPKNQPSRVAACPCGSGKRYKHCCGRHAEPISFADPREMDVAQRAAAAFRSGEAYAAMELLKDVVPEDLNRADSALVCGEMYASMTHYEKAYAFFYRAAALGAKEKAAQATIKACTQCFNPESRAMVRRLVGRRVEHFNNSARRRGAATPEIHIIAHLKQPGGSEHRALGLFRLLSPHVRTRVWSTVSPLPELAAHCPVELIDVVQGHYPRSGHLVFVGVYFEYGDWLAQSQARRITICYNTDNPGSLIERLVELENLPTAFSLDFSFPSRHFHDAAGVVGEVEYPPVDVSRFRRIRDRSCRAGPMVVGRHSRDDRLKYHPNDPSFFRCLAGLGHQVRIAGGTCLIPALRGNGLDEGITIEPVLREGVVEFLDGLDCFIYRIHPHLHETGGTSVLEAMAMSLPVVVFGERVGVAELIEHERNGFVVDTEEEALLCIERLAGNPALGQAMGAAARATLVEVMSMQERTLLEFYLKDKADFGITLDLPKHPLRQ